MKSYEVKIGKSAEKELMRLPSTILKRIILQLQLLADNPRPTGCKKLKGFEDLWRIRVGSYRVIYAINDIVLLIDVRAIGHRRNVYQ